MLGLEGKPFASHARFLNCIVAIWKLYPGMTSAWIEIISRNRRIKNAIILMYLWGSNLASNNADHEADATQHGPRIPEFILVKYKLTANREYLNI